MAKLPPSCIRDLKLPSSVRDYYAADDGAKYLSRLSRLNVFIGPNNSGKSRLLRHLFLDTSPAFSTGGHAEFELRAAMEKAAALFSRIQLSESGPLWSQVKRLKECLEPLWRSEGESTYEQHPFAGSNFNINDFRVRPPQWFAETCQANGLPEQESWDLIAGFAGEPFKHSGTKHPALKKDRVYIPAFRSLHNFDSPAESPPEFPALRRAAIRSYFGTHPKLQLEVNAGKASEDPFSPMFTGGEFFNLFQSWLLGEFGERQRIREFEEWLSNVFFDDNRITLIPRRGKSVLQIRIGNEEYSVENLGDGIQQIIIMSLPLFLYKGRPLLLFIEEPELYLHPGFQRVFIDLCLNPVDPQHQIFVATHSHQFIDITVDRDLCSVFRVTKDISGESPQFSVSQSSTDDFDLLRLLGIRNSSVLLSNCTIWVEGITDRLYFRHYISMYVKYLIETKSGVSHKLIEDLHYSFVEYSGGNITHWSFLDEESGMDARRVCSELLLIADSDDAESGAKADRHKKLELVLGDRFVRLPCREVENLILPEVLLKVIGDYEGWEKPSLIQVSQSEYLTEYLGTFIESKFFRETKSKRPIRKKKSPESEEGKPYADKSGTIKDKDAFCDRAIRFTTEWSLVSPQAQEITRRIFRFICHKNGFTSPYEAVETLPRTP